jgi:hypothetical protein
VQPNLDAPYREFGCDISGPKMLRSLLPPQCRIHVAKRETTDEPVSLFPGTESGLLLDFVREVPVVGSAQDDHLFCGLGPLVQFDHPV